MNSIGSVAPRGLETMFDTASITLPQFALAIAVIASLFFAAPFLKQLSQQGNVGCSMQSEKLIGSAPMDETRVPVALPH